MFLTYLRRELRRRARQASIIALGLALGIGLVITVTALSSGVKNAQAEVLHSLYGQDTDITVTKTPTFSGGGSFSFRGAGAGASGTGTRPKAGSTVSIDNLTATGLAAISGSDVTAVSKMKNVAAAAGGLTLNDTKLSFTVPSSSSSGSGGFGGGGGFSGSGHFPTPISVDGVGVSGAGAALGPLSSAKLSSGRTFASADANADVAVVDSTYAKTSKLAVGSTVTLAKTSFKIVGIVSQSAASSPPDVFIPLARAQALGTSDGKSLKGDVNTIYVAANSASNITSVSKDISAALPGTTVTNSSDLASELTGSVSTASSLANNLGRWLAIAVLIAAFLLASLLTASAVSRRVREFGTLKALGWNSRRVVGQVVGEAITIGIIGGIAGVGLGFLGAALVGHFTSPLTAAIAPTTGTATPGGARTFTGGGGFGGGGGGGGGFDRIRNASAAAHPVTVHLSAPVTASAIAAAVVLALLGGLIAGGFGGWRAARLRPAAALARVE
ncbi:MAG TPA: ABC transporter permease [Streptosporangiaceae bacterium]|jgi:putative ABC transport system permease protein|nr:ABC transporter permease [Streptosporangiaceae bacterium]